MTDKEKEVIESALDYFYGFHYRGKKIEDSQPYNELLGLLSKKESEAICTSEEAKMFYENYYRGGK